MPDTLKQPGTDVDLGVLGKGKFLPGVEGSSLVVQPNADWFVRVTGTMASAPLQQLAAGLKLS